MKGNRPNRGLIFSSLLAGSLAVTAFSAASSIWDHDQFNTRAGLGGSHSADHLDAEIPRSYALAATVSLDEVDAERLLPLDVAVLPDGTFLVADFATQSIIAFDADGVERQRRRSEFASFGCDVLYTPVAMDTNERGEVATLWHAFEVVDGVPSHGVKEGYVELRTSEGDLETVFRVAYPFNDIALHGDLIFLAQGTFIEAFDRRGMIDPERRLDVAVNRSYGGSFDMLAVDRVVRIRVDGTVLINTVRPNTVKILDIGGRVPLALDARDGVIHVLAVDPPTGTLSHVEADGERRILRDLPLAAPYDPATFVQWPTSMAVGPSSMPIITADDAGLLVAVFGPDDQEAVRLRGSAPIGTRLNQPPLGDWTACRSGNMLLGTPSDDGLMVYDDRVTRLVAFNAALERVGSRAITTTVTSIDAHGPLDNEVLLSRTNGRLVRMPWHPTRPPAWDAPGVCQDGQGRVAWSGSHAAVACRIDRRIHRIDPATGASTASIDGASDSGLWPFDIALFPDGELIATDLLEKRLQRFAADGTPLDDVVAGYAVGPQFVGVVDHPELGRMVVTSMWDDHLELRELSTGNLLVRWPAEARGAPIRVSDVAIDGQLRVFVLDGRSRRLHRFDPQPDAAPEPEITPTPSRTSCVVEGDKVAGPRTVVLGETASITLTLQADCPLAHTEGRADLLIVADESSSMYPVADALVEAVTAFARVVDLSRHRLGLVVFRAAASVARPLSHEPGDLALPLLEPTGPGRDGTDIAEGLAVAREHLLRQGDPSALPILILMSDGEDADPKGVIEEARRTRAAGIQIVVIAMGRAPNDGVLRQLASSESHYFTGLSPDDFYFLYAKLSHAATASRIGDLVVRDTLSDDVEIVGGSAFPPASEGADSVLWGRGVMPSTGLTMSFQVRPLHIGTDLPTNREAIATYTDADGAERQFVFPIPRIDVIAPTASPSPPPSATPTPGPTRTPGPSTVYLPIALGERPCQPELAPLDVILILDASTSMTGVKLAGAKAAAGAFVEMLSLGKDRVGLVTFNASARLEIGLATDGTAFLAAVDGIVVAPGTRMDNGLGVALGTMLVDPRPEARPAMVILTDGRQDADPKAAIDAAAAVRRAGIELVAVGLGGDADVHFLEKLVGDPRKVRRAADPAALADVYRQLARELPCDDGLWWGGRANTVHSASP